MEAPGRVAGSPGDPMIGRVLEGRYRLLSRIARGGMATVYEALDLRLDRTVAVKVMHPGLGDDDEFAARFVREARAAARLSHPHVVAVHDQGDDDGTVFLVMELVQGHTLHEVIAKEAPMAPARALELLEPVLSALASAHRAGLVHRDVKPANVLIADDGRVKVADFGLAKAVSADTQHTATQGVLIGTVSYLAPELVVEGRADTRADVYAVGVLLYELLTGVKPHEGETVIQVAYKHVHQDVPPPSQRVPHLPPYVDALVARATARDRTLRPADAAVMLHQVHRVGSALADGVADDPELTEDLAPRLRAGHDDEVDAPAQRGGRGDTAPQVWDEGEMATLLAPMAPPPAAPGGPTGPPPAHPPRQTRAEATTLLRAHHDDRAATPPHGGAGTARAARGRRRRGPLLLALALAVALAAGGGAYWFGWARYTSTPGVILLPQAQAERTLEQAGLEVAYDDPAFSETVPAGQVLATEPSPGDRVLSEGTVTLTVSQGPERYEVPAVARMTEDQAQDALLERKLSFDESIERFSENVPEGQVIRTIPEIRTVLRPGGSVDLVVSKGRQPLRVGDWVGESLEEMRSTLEDRGLVVEVAGEEFSDTVAEGDVISHDPAGGTLFRGETVEAVVSQGPELLPVPSVVGFGVEAARQTLQEAGFEVEIERDDDFISIGFVLRMDPGAGAEAPRGSTVTIVVV
ncbi:PASTA domain-containing protein [Nocardioides nanhaiensis]|uniref:non-specific serine/threonine protein kinase n=1 Tax=Nocardioides nanhaiensis TaxID=1476871 RepID=A0ABP8WS24_9ACTN